MTAIITPATVLQRGKGKGRDPWNIKRWLAGTELKNAAEVGRRTGKHHNVVGETLAGIRNDKAVLEFLEQNGCPKKLLYPMEAA